MSKTLASRLREAMEQVIHQDQTYCVPGRSIVDNVHLIRDVLEISRSLDADTGLISLDQEKAFDQVEHQFLWTVMERFGFSPGFMIRVLYCDIASMLKFNGSLCAPFRVRRGVRQGCALSGMLYALSLEPLLSRIRASVDGLILPSFHKKNSSICLRRRYNSNGSTGTRVKPWPLAGGKWSASPSLGSCLAKGRLKIPRGRTLVLNNLVASVLWHRLNCAEPPSGLLEQLQASVLSFFWDGMHWVQQGMLYLPREEGGQGLIHLASRTATFRIQFIQRFLTGPVDLMWRDVERCVFRRHVVAAAGPDLTGVEAVGSLLGICSAQAAERALQLWRNRLSERERRLLVDYGQGTEPDCEDPFPEIRLAAHLGNLDGPLLRPSKTFSLQAVEKKTLYYECVRVLNRRGLSNRSTSVWADRLGGDGARPCWRVLYKPPLKKRTGDLQWRILHGAVALNALLSKMNNAVSDRHHHYYGINISRNHLSNTNNPPFSQSKGSFFSPHHLRGNIGSLN
ncbi:Transposon TX1 uncharacterized 149 kDa protein ORF 2 [Takifugu flavidus]|uniref:Transposon TX1 uncharacterized 149 kDa protein ORF 2 n=1 Tax=Takifugu flavidus TaxID=433684 RepID=A0A5C6MFL6_9TELE|nr:Transposon TX1 uncharacterized 149 kDa protein ORF 2 [Takifugu flavidus]